jgi:hypothetical protein
VLAHLNAALRGVAEEHGAQVADIHGVFLGHGLSCGDPPPTHPPAREPPALVLQHHRAERLGGQWRSGCLLASPRRTYSGLDRTSQSMTEPPQQSRPSSRTLTESLASLGRQSRRALAVPGPPALSQVAAKCNERPSSRPMFAQTTRSWSSSLERTRTPGPRLAKSRRRRRRRSSVLAQGRLRSDHARR